MFKQRYFQIALAISLIAHSFFFTTWSGGGSLTDIRKPSRHIELVYLLPAPKDIEALVAPAKAAVQRAEEVGVVDEREEKVPVPQKKDFAEEELITAKAEEDDGSVARERTLSELASMELDEKENYVDYCFFIRENIQRALNDNYHSNQSYLEGDVLLNFTLYANGELKKSCVVDSYSTAGPLIRTLVLKSLRGASPFPPFPKGLRRSEVSFNIPIAFETE